MYKNRATEITLLEGTDLLHKYNMIMYHLLAGHALLTKSKSSWKSHVQIPVDVYAKTRVTEECMLIKTERKIDSKQKYWEFSIWIWQILIELFK